MWLGSNCACCEPAPLRSSARGSECLIGSHMRCTNLAPSRLRGLPFADTTASDDVDMVSKERYIPLRQSRSLPNPQSGPTEGVHLSCPDRLLRYCCSTHGSHSLCLAPQRTFRGNDIICQIDINTLGARWLARKQFKLKLPSVPKAALKNE